jgi:molybdopterin-guanine dinucleotide biosynthesis protein A
VTGLEAAPHPIVVVVGGDMPSLIPKVLQLLAAEVAAGAAAAALEDGGRQRPLPAAFERSAGLAAARGVLRGEEPARLRDVLSTLDAVVVPEAVWRELDPEARTLRDVDRPADLAALAGLDVAENRS